MPPTSTYGTNNEFGFDYLRDNMVTYKERMVQRELNFAIVDEVDSILIDEARTPLIISGQGDKSTDLYAPGQSAGAEFPGKDGRRRPRRFRKGRKGKALHPHRRGRAQGRTLLRHRKHHRSRQYRNPSPRAGRPFGPIS